MEAMARQMLGTIRDLYGRVRDLTVRLIQEFSPAALDETIRARSLVLLRIDTEVAALRNTIPPHLWSGFDQCREIRDHIAALIALDRQVASRITHSMGEIRGELSALSSSSRAAETYTRHCLR
jgi:hypothetical protein